MEVEEEFKNPMGDEIARLSHKYVMRLSEASREEKAALHLIRKTNGGAQEE